MLNSTYFALRSKASRQAVLAAFMSEDSVAFAPLVDVASGRDTYGAGRYLERAHQDGNRDHLDLNPANNPWCACSPEYSRLIPPKINRRLAPIRAEEKDFG